ncbi:MAG: hypothetical protein VSS75_026520 [Candidatus Parabeggiatoa sp.]|nr:hypothetical protein [Candidatus Parabeggiatoa sp.]
MSKDYFCQWRLNAIQSVRLECKIYFALVRLECKIYFALVRLECKIYFAKAKIDNDPCECALQRERLSAFDALRQAQRWVRDSTYGEMLTYCDQMVNEKAFFKRFRKEIGFAGMDERGFEHPFYWGTFGYVGV